jgi:hypothetical protein
MICHSFILKWYTYHQGRESSFMSEIKKRLSNIMTKISMLFRDHKQIVKHYIKTSAAASSAFFALKVTSVNQVNHLL